MSSNERRMRDVAMFSTGLIIGMMITMAMFVFGLWIKNGGRLW